MSNVPYFRAKEIAPRSWQIEYAFTDKEHVYCYLAEGRDYALAALSYDFYEHVGAYTGPVIMFQGDADDMEPKEFSDRAASCYADLDYEIIPGAGHMFEGEDRAHVAARIAAFVAEHSRG